MVVALLAAPLVAASVGLTQEKKQRRAIRQTDSRRYWPRRDDRWNRRRCWQGRRDRRCGRGHGICRTKRSKGQRVEWAAAWIPSRAARIIPGECLNRSLQSRGSGGAFELAAGAAVPEEYSQKQAKWKQASETPTWIRRRRS